MSQSVSKPIFSLGSADGVVGAHFEKVRDSLNVFASIGKKVEKHISALS